LQQNRNNLTSQQNRNNNFTEKQELRKIVGKKLQMFSVMPEECTQLTLGSQYLYRVLQLKTTVEAQTRRKMKQFKYYERN
jgi:hypothetical protein